jgi:hypothetical protein
MMTIAKMATYSIAGRIRDPILLFVPLTKLKKCEKEEGIWNARVPICFCLTCGGMSKLSLLVCGVTSSSLLI